MKLLYLNIFLILLISCGDIVDAEPQNITVPNTYLRARWNIERIKEAPLEIYLGLGFVDILPEESDDKDCLNLIEQMADIWNKGHPDLDFFGLPFLRGENKTYTNLDDFLDDTSHRFKYFKRSSFAYAHQMLL